MYGPMYIYLKYNPPYSETHSKVFEVKFNFNCLCIHGYPNSRIKLTFATPVSKEGWNIFTKTFPDALQMVKFPKRGFCNKCQHVDNTKEKPILQIYKIRKHSNIISQHHILLIPHFFKIIY